MGAELKVSFLGPLTVDWCRNLVPAVPQECLKLLSKQIYFLWWLLKVRALNALSVVVMHQADLADTPTVQLCSHLFKFENCRSHICRHLKSFSKPLVLQLFTNNQGIHNFAGWLYLYSAFDKLIWISHSWLWHFNLCQAMLSGPVADTRRKSEQDSLITHMFTLFGLIMIFMCKGCKGRDKRGRTHFAPLPDTPWQGKSSTWQSGLKTTVRESGDCAPSAVFWCSVCCVPFYWNVLTTRHSDENHVTWFSSVGQMQKLIFLRVLKPLTYGTSHRDSVPNGCPLIVLLMISVTSFHLWCLVIVFGEQHIWVHWGLNTF